MPNLSDKAKAALAKLSKDDWQFIEYSVTVRIAAASPKRGEPPASKEFKDQVSRIQAALMAAAFGVWED